MKNIISIKLLTLVLLAGMLASCGDDFLEETPKLAQSSELTLSTYAGLESATAAGYGNFSSGTWYAGHFVITADLKGGNAKRGPVSSGRYISEYFWTNNPTATSGLWATAYQTIARSNNVINAIDGGFSEVGVTQAQLDQLKGENLFLRAISHWDLVRMYSQPYISGRDNMGVPIRLVTANEYPSRNTVGEVYDQVVADLQAAIPLMAPVAPRGNDRAWATSHAAKALLAKVYLYMENWQGAANMASEVISSGSFTLFTAAQYSTYANGGYWGNDGPGGAEIIFHVDGTQTNSAHPYWEAISYMVDPEGYGDIATSHDLLDLFEPGDVRANLFQQPEAYPNEYWTLKYPGRLGATPRREFKLPVLRLAEMYLIRAEALLHGASVAGATALGDLNAIRTKRGLAEASSVSLIDIYEERRRELNFEGNELFDLARTGRSLVRNDYDGVENQNVPFVLGGTPAQNYLWAMPIPQSEIDANENMEQNPGY